MTSKSGSRIRQARKSVFLTQIQVASRLGVTSQAVTRWEKDVSQPSRDNIGGLAQIFGVTTDWLLNGVGSSSDAVKQNKIQMDGGQIPRSKLNNVDIAGSTIDGGCLSGLKLLNVEFSGGRIVNANLFGLQIVDCKIDGMTINGILVSELFAAYETQKAFKQS